MLANPLDDAGWLLSANSREPAAASALLRLPRRGERPERAVPAESSSNAERRPPDDGLGVGEVGAPMEKVGVGRAIG